MTDVRTVSLIGAPTDIGAGDRGASMGPEALRVAGLQARCKRGASRCVDRGNLRGPPNPWQPPVDGYRHLAEVTEWNRLRARRGARRTRARDTCRCCSAAITASRSVRSARSPVIAGERQAKLRVLWLDAHADFNTHILTPSGNVHGMPVACLCGYGPRRVAGIGGHAPAIDPRWIRQIGIRSVDQGEKRSCTSRGSKCSTCATSTRWACGTRWSRRCCGLDDDTHVHVSFDVDFLDPDIAPGVGTTVPGGPSYREAQLCMEMIADTGRLRSLDVMELNPALDVRNRTARVAVDLIESLFGKSTLMRR